MPPSSKRGDQHKGEVYAYVRLSRDDEKQAGSLEEKFSVRSGICKRLAEENGLNLPEANIFLEQKSGKLLSARPKMLHLLDLVREGKVSGIITPYIDRMIRGDKADEARIEDAFCLGGIKVWTYEQVAPIIFDEDYDPLMFEVKASLARNELRTFARRRKATDREKLSRGKRSRAVAPFGYRYLRETFDPLGNRLTESRHEVIESEFPILQEIFARVRTEPLRAVCRDFNARGLPGPGVGRTDRPAARWMPNSLRNIVLNPFYAGYLSQRSKKVRGKMIMFNVADYVLSDAKGDWPTVISLEDWHDLAATWAQRTRPTRAPESDGILNGLLYNFCGRPMIYMWSGYSCRCGDTMAFHEVYPAHKCLQIAGSKIHRYVFEVLSLLIDQLPAGELPVPKKTKSDVKMLVRQINALRVDIESAEIELDDMMAKQEQRIRDYSAPRFWRVKNSYEAKVISLKQEVAAKEAERAEAEDAAIGAGAYSAIRLFREIGFRCSWEEMTNSDRRRIAGEFIRRIDFLESDQKRTSGVGASRKDVPLERNRLKGCVVTLRSWCAPYLPPADIPKLPSRYAR